jgi:cytochrome c oxidase accessory protein FixG
MATDSSSVYQYEEEYRNTLSTVDAEGKRVWIYPKKPAGPYHTARLVVTAILLVLFFGGPFFQINGRPLLLFNVFERKFIIFGQAFWPQDFVLLALTLITLFVFIILFTVAFGRLWCGWACPQTIFMENVFRKIEYWIEGDANQQRKLDAAPWDQSKILKKGFKHFLFIAISVLIAHVAMAYLIGIDQVKQIVTESPAEHFAGFLGLLLFTGIFYGVFARFREQACIAVCPYGRLQSVLLVKNSVVVIYDWLRGEPRGKIKKNQPPAEPRGHCVDCKLCVHVCPTGIDIRNGTQLECVNCTACIDVCDDVMEKVGYPKGLIRYSSYSAIEQGKQKIFTPRIAGYAAVLTALVSLLGYLIFTRADVEMTVLKAPGTLYTKTEDGTITNVYNIEFVNKTFEDIPIEVRVESPASATLSKIGTGPLVIPKEGLAKNLYIVKIPEGDITGAKTSIVLTAYQNGKKIESATARFVGPIKIKKATL